jgi:hypothetical protein
MTTRTTLTAAYPTQAHETAAGAIISYFQALPETETILLVNSTARGRATADSCLDMVVFTSTEMLALCGDEMQAGWQDFYQSDPRFSGLRQSGRFAEVHLDILDGFYQLNSRTIDDPADSFELEVGNHLAYSAILWERSDYTAHLKATWLPYYSEELRQERLKQVQAACRHNLEHVPLYAARELYFAAFDRLYTAFQLFMEALFISRSTYPIAYNKWIREQVEDILGLADLYRVLPGLLEVRPFQSSIVVSRADELDTLLSLYTEG